MTALRLPHCVEDSACTEWIRSQTGGWPEVTYGRDCPRRWRFWIRSVLRYVRFIPSSSLVGVRLRSLSGSRRIP